MNPGPHACKVSTQPMELHPSLSGRGSNGRNVDIRDPGVDRIRLLIWN